MKHLFSINKDCELNQGSQRLLLEMGDHFCSIGVVDEEKRELCRFDHYITDEKTEYFFSQILEKHPELKRNDFPRAISFLTHGNVLIPGPLYEDANGATPPGLPRGKNKHAAEFLDTMDIYNVYPVQESFNLFVHQVLATDKRWHFYSVRLWNLEGRQKEVFYLDFKPDQFSIIYFSESGLQLCQVCYYHSSMDLLYFLLKICKCFKISREKLQVVLSGFIEKDSQLYEDLKKYFINTRFESLPGGIRIHPAFEKYPGYYFTSICNLASCVLSEVHPAAEE